MPVYFTTLYHEKLEVINYNTVVAMAEMVTIQLQKKAIFTNSLDHFENKWYLSQ